MGALRVIHMRYVAAVLAVLWNGYAQADSQPADADARIESLEKQVQMMSEQLKLLQEQLQQAKSSSVPTSDTASGAGAASSAGVTASFKDGLVFKDGTGNWSFRPYLRTQFDYRHYSPGNFVAETFSLRRIRLGGIATFYKDFTLRIEGEYGEISKGSSPTCSTGNVCLNDGYLDFTHWKAANIRLGQFKPYYGLERATAAFSLNFMERSLLDSVLPAVFDRGVMVHGEPLPGLYYSIAYVNGTGQNVDESSAKQDGKDVTVRVTGNIAEWAGWKNSVAHLGGFYVSGRENAGSAIPQPRTEGRGVKFFSTTSTINNLAGTAADTFDVGFDRILGGGELALAYGPVKLQSEYVHANYNGGTFDRNISAGYASLQWMVSGEHYADTYKKSVFGNILPKRDLDLDHDGWGALELGMRYSWFDASDFTTSNTIGTGKLAAGTSTNKADAWTLGAKWILNQNAMLLLNYVHTAFDTPITPANSNASDTEDAVNMRVQFDF